jgi:hypothetical protein
MKRILFISVILLFVTAGLANAQRANRNVAARQVTQQTRIMNGVQRGQLTRQETMKLERQQKHIQTQKRIAKADGTVTPKEARKIRREQNRANRQIRKEKMDGQTPLN